MKTHYKNKYKLKTHMHKYSEKIKHNKKKKKSEKKKFITNNLNMPPVLTVPQLI